jgi:pimeloyl-ACP methyl ester carboxylesterase
MKNLRIYGKAPYRITVIHGGPGAPGEMAPVARELSVQCGVLEPLQTMTTVEGQVEELAAVGRNIHCPVVAIHGDCDPHPAEGIEMPLSSVIADFRFVLLERCGHHPWYERYAKEPFYAILKQEIA